MHLHGPMVRERELSFYSLTAVGRMRCQVASRRGEREMCVSAKSHAPDVYRERRACSSLGFGVQVLGFRV